MKKIKKHDLNCSDCCSAFAYTQYEENEILPTKCLECVAREHDKHNKDTSYQRQYFFSLIRKPVRKWRKCLICFNSFESSNSGHRRCVNCSEVRSKKGELCYT